MRESEKQLKYKVLKEYNNYYLTQCSAGYKICFNKHENKPINGYIFPKISNFTGGVATPPEHVNRSFNLFGRTKWLWMTHTKKKGE